MVPPAAQQQLEADLEEEAGNEGALRLDAATKKEYDAIQAKAGAATGRMKQELQALQSALQVLRLSSRCHEVTSHRIRIKSIHEHRLVLAALHISI